TPAGPEEEVPLQGLRRRIAERMTESWRTIPHVTAFEEVDATRLVALRERLQPAATAQGTKLTYLPLVIKAVVVALKEHPYLNATFDDAGGKIRLKRYYHIGVATATPDGLLVPVVRDADRKNAAVIATELQRLAEGARSRRLAPGELTGGTFTVSNFGSYGGTWGTPIINPPEVAILGVGKLAESPAVQDGQLVVRPTLPLSLSFDHRIIDGEGAGRFMARLCALLRDPELLILELV
ncbi:MAG: 2-oxo acid dehydrogenase subunit, partial [Firmicutes bacterium]|nr:2-oxo acid dehydrogenase subunit [Bacillota bacterium]